jgi:hypothetical protein
MKGFNHLFDVFPDGPPLQGRAIGLRNPQVRAAFDEVIIFLEDRVGSKTKIPPHESKTVKKFRQTGLR